MTAKTVHLIAGARPNFMKVAPLWRALAEAPDFQPVLVHTGQHYTASMSDDLLRDLGLPEPDFHLGVGSGSHAEQTGRVMIAYESIARDASPDWLVVVGDVNSTLACALVGAKLRIPTVHLEAGLRSRDRRMPEEINRVATDSVCDVLWTPSPDADLNLVAEGVPEARITRIGNIMIDSLEMCRPAIEAARTAQRFGLAKGGYCVATLHRPSNVDQEDVLKSLVEALLEVQKRLPVVLPAHPRTAARMSALGLDSRLQQAGVQLIEPLPYIEFMGLMVDARLVVTDSGGLQEETTYLGIPCFTLRENTERPITIEQGTNRLATPSSLPCLIDDAMGSEDHRLPRIPLWDGKAADRCLSDLRRRSGSDGGIAPGHGDQE